LERGTVYFRGDLTRCHSRIVSGGSGMVDGIALTAPPNLEPIIPEPINEQPATVTKVQNVLTRCGRHSVPEQLNVAVHQGEILGVVGGSGTGKSVLLRSMVGLLRPSEGTVEVFGQDFLALSDAEREPLQRRMGVLFQQGALYSSLTLAENVA